MRPGRGGPRQRVGGITGGGRRQGGHRSVPSPWSAGCPACGHASAVTPTHPRSHHVGPEDRADAGGAHRPRVPRRASRCRCNAAPRTPRRVLLTAVGWLPVGAMLVHMDLLDSAITAADALSRAAAPLGITAPSKVRMTRSTASGRCMFDVKAPGHHCPAGAVRCCKLHHQGGPRRVAVCLQRKHARGLGSGPAIIHEVFAVFCSAAEGGKGGVPIRSLRALRAARLRLRRRESGAVPCPAAQ